MRYLFSLASLCATFSLFAAEPLLIHEWGTFTSLQDEAGRTIGGLNSDEEALPDFIHDLSPIGIDHHGEISAGLGFLSKGVARGDPTVTMRLETPVIYAHLPPGQKSATFDLAVEFRGGFLSQFYPMAQPTVNDRPLRWYNQEYSNTVEEKITTYNVREIQVQNEAASQQPIWSRWNAPSLSSSTTSSLAWRGITVGGSDSAPETASPVWLAPRKVDAANLTVGSEHERYLFYRGLGHLDAPLKTTRSADGATLTVSARPEALGSRWMSNYRPRMWFADLHADGTAAFRTISATGLYVFDPHNPPVAAQTFSAVFNAEDFSAERLRLLRQELHADLVQNGLFADEAQALLTTWEASYFKAPGQRLFFLVPPAWTDHVLPLTISTPAKVTRAMMGRIELVSPMQRQALTRIANGPISTRDWFDQFVKEHIGYVHDEKYIDRPGGSELQKRLFITHEQGIFAQLKVPVPADYQAYLALGRFRDALLWETQSRAPSPELARFLRTYVLGAYGYMLLQDWQKKILPDEPVTTATKAP